MHLVLMKYIRLEELKLAALAFGTESIKLIKLWGLVTHLLLKQKSSFMVMWDDSIAGPSEILVIADEYNNPKWVAMDLLSQAEHDEEARAILISDSKDFIKKVNKHLLVFLKSIKEQK